MSTEKFLFEIAADTKKLRDELKKSQTESGKLTDDLKKTEKTSSSFGKNLSSVGKGVGIFAAAVTAAATAVTAFAVAQGRSIRETEAMAAAANMNSEEFKKMSFIMGTAGISGEKFGDIMKDTQEKVGDFLATGGGAFQDFADVMGYTSTQAAELAREFETMSGQEVLQSMVNKMDAAGKSSQQMSFALEGMASDTTRLIPLLKDGGAAAKDLGDKYDKINIELTDDEKAQFKDLADNVDLATASFTNMMQNAVVPLIPKMNELLESFTGFFKESATKTKVFRIYQDQDLIKDIDNLDEIDELTKQLAKDRAELLNKASAGNVSDGFLADQLVNLALAEDNLAAQKKILEIKQALAAIDEDAKPEEESSSTGGKNGADEIKLEEKLAADLKARQDAQKSELKLLYDEKAARLEILEGMFDAENELTAEKLKEKNDLKSQIEADYTSRARDIAQTEEEAKLEAIVNEQKSLEEILNHKLISQEEYQAKLKEIIMAYAPETVDPDALEEKNEAALESLNEQLENKLISYEDYFSKLGTLGKKDTDDKKKKDKLENFWSDSSTKTQLDQGTQLLTSLGNNSKKAHKIKQGLAAANAGMNAAESITKAMTTMDYAGAALAAVVGITQVAAILSSTPDGGGATVTPPAEGQKQPVESYSEQSTTVTDVSGGGTSSQRMVIEFNDEVVDVIARKIGQAQSDGRV